MPNDQLYLQDIIKAIIAINEFIGEKSLEDFIADNLLQSAVLYKLTVIGEAVVKTSKSIKLKYPEVNGKTSPDFETL